MREDDFKKFSPPQSNSRDVALDNEILRVEVGSSLTGIIGSNSANDFDYYGIFIEPLRYVVGFHRQEHYQFRSQPTGVRSQPGDIDYTCYSLRKFMNLALAGNPQILFLLFAPQEFVTYSNWVGHEIRFHKEAIISKKAGPRFLGYMDSQHKRLVGELKSHMPKRPELIAAYGYDTKYAAHALRLGFQGIELMETGSLTLPIPNDPGNFLRDVRAGEYSLQYVIEILNNLREELVHAMKTSALPEEPNYEFLEEWMIYVHKLWWEGV